MINHPKNMSWDFKHFRIIAEIRFVHRSSYLQLGLKKPQENGFYIVSICTILRNVISSFYISEINNRVCPNSVTVGKSSLLLFNLHYVVVFGTQMNLGIK